MIESLIYFYILICISLILFNIAYVISKSIRNTTLEPRSTKFKKLFDEEVNTFKDTNEISSKYKQYLDEKLKRVRLLIVFQHKIEKLQETEPELGKKFLEGIMPTIFGLHSRYNKKSNDEKAYFAYILSTLDYSNVKPNKQIIDIMIEYLNVKSIYVKTNTMKAIYKMGDVQVMIRAIKVEDASETFYHAKLLTDGLLTFSKNKEELNAELWKILKTLTPETQVAIIDYYRICGADFKEELIQFLKNEETDLEVKCSVIRYYTKYKHQEALEILSDYVKDDELDSWITKSTSILALKNYECNEVKEVLKKELSSRNWFIRNNSAKVLTDWGLSEEDIMDIFKVEDKFAQEILIYYLRGKAQENKLIEKIIGYLENKEKESEMAKCC